MSEFYLTRHLSTSYYQTVIKNAQGKPAYLLVGQWGRKEDQLSLYQFDGTLVAQIKQLSSDIQYRFILYQHNHKIGTIQKVFPLPHHFYFVRHLNWFIYSFDGQKHFTIRDFNQPIMMMQQTVFQLKDCYHLLIQDEYHAPICICIAAILDYWLWRKHPDPFTSKIDPKKIIQHSV